MPWTSTPAPFRFCVAFWGLLLLSWLSPFASRAQAQGVPPGEGLVTDSTELAALRTLYVATNGPQWAKHANWGTGTTLADAATWFGVQVDGGDVTALSLADNNLRGTLPARLGQLSGLTALYLMRNQLSGPLPEALGQLQRLEVFYVSHNQLSGSIPSSLGNWPVRELGLDNNRLSGVVPAALGRLANLQALYLNNNDLSGGFPAALLQCARLRVLYLSNNRFAGALPAAWGGLPSLTELGLNNNRFSGTVPAGLRQAPVATLYLFGNAFTGLPTWAGATRVPDVLYVHDNELDFAALEANFTGPGAPVEPLFYYDPQRPPGPTDTLWAVAGQPAALNGAIGGAHNRYRWQREVGGQWVDVPGATDSVLVRPAVVSADAGRYRTQVTNAWLLWTTLYSRPHYLDVLPYPAPPRNRPDDANQGLALAALRPAADAEADTLAAVNFVRTWTPRVALTDSLRVPRAGVDSVALSTGYLDGLGRPVQTVLRQASPQRRDLVQPHAYDALGREPKQYLPYPAAMARVVPGGYRPRALTDQQAFYHRPGPPGGGIGPLASNDPAGGVARTGAAFAETVFEASPLNRAMAQGAAGETWQVTNGHVVERAERPNTAADSVLRFAPGYAPAVVDPGYRGFYAPGELWGTDVADAHGPNEPGAHGYRTIEWKDKEGQLVARQVEAGRRRVPIASGTGAGEEVPAGDDAPLLRRWLRTAYAYDDFGRLRYVLQPEGTKHLLPLAVPAGGAAPWPSAAAPFLFHYRFDARGRQIAKQVPGTDGETLVVFDQLDRPVLSQDAAQRARREWSWTKYDALGRVILSGLVLRGDTAGQVTLQALAAADTAPETQYEQRTAAGPAHPHGYTTAQAFPRLGQQDFGPGTVLSATYYDDYNFDNDAAGTADATYNASTDGQFPAGAAPVADALRTTGLATRTKTRVLGVDPADQTQAVWLTTTTFYDERTRPVQVQTTNARKNPLTGQVFTDLLTTRLNFPGQVVQSVAVHEGPSHTPVTVAEFFAYDHTGRLLTTRQQLPGEAQPALLASVAYNEIGQATQKTMGTGRLAQQVDYAYNIRGWLTQLNNPFQPVPGDLFHLSLHYEAGFTKGYEQYNGNLTGQTWRGRDGVQRAYGYVYDPLNRLLQGDFVARHASAAATPNTAGLWKAEEDNYRMSFVSYDDNGNIRTLRRRGLLANATRAAAKQYGPVDHLAYAYQGNRLQAVDDQVSTNQLPRPTGYEGAPTSLAGDFQEGGTRLGQEYLYDANGNLTQDRNKGITAIAYNHLSLPTRIAFGTGADSLVFRYTAAGQKVAKLVYQTGKPTLRTDYLGPYQYEQDSLRFFPHAEGRVLRFANRTSGAVRYEREFTFKDHLGNLRLAYRLGQRHVYEATLEPDSATHGRESQQFDSLSVSPPVAVPTGLARTGAYAARLHAGGSTPQPLGPLTQLTVQKGDTLLMTAPGRYPQATSSNSFAFSLAGFVASLLQPGPGAPTGADGRRRGGLPLLQVGLSAATLTALNQLPGGVPKGYLRVLSFNEDSVLVDQRTVQLSAAALNNYETLSTGQLIVQQNGYVTVYVGNESAADVYFDDVRIEHRQGLQVQENQYDPFGLDLAGVSGAAPGLRGKNFYQFNGKENQLDLGLNWNHQDARFYDYQLGRWHVVDPMIEDGQENWTPYAFSYNNAVRYSDPDGQFPPLLVAAAAGAAIGAIIGGGIEAGTQMYKNGGHVSDWHAVGGAALQGGVTGGVAGLTGGTILLRSGAAGAISNVAGGIARNVHDGKPVTVGSVTKDAAVGAAIGVAGYAAGKAVGAVANRLKGGAASTEATVTQNAKQGAAFEKVVTKQLKSRGHTDVAEQVTVKPNGLQTDGKPYPNVRLDNVSRNQNGAVVLTDAKSSATAGLTKNQKIGYPALQQNGGTVMGQKGADLGYPAGFQIGPTKVIIVRP